MITKDLLFIRTFNKLFIINVNQFRLVIIIEVLNSYCFFGFCLLNENMFLTGKDGNRIIRLREIEGDNIILISKREKAHDKNINSLIKKKDGYIASDSSDKLI